MEEDLGISSKMGVNRLKRAMPREPQVMLWEMVLGTHYLDNNACVEI